MNLSLVNVSTRVALIIQRQQIRRNMRQIRNQQIKVLQMYNKIYNYPVQTVPLSSGLIKILFVDTGNTGRSVMGEAIANKIIIAQKLNMACLSRGCNLNTFASFPEQNGVTLLQQHGTDVSGHVAIQLTIHDINRPNVIVLTATESNKETVLELFPTLKNIYTLGNFANGFLESNPVPHTKYDVPDAYGKSMDFYIDTYNAIDEYVIASIALLPTYIFK